MKKLLSIPLSVFLLLSCAVNSGVVPLSENEFFISKQAGYSFTGYGTLKAEAIQEGQSFCKGQNKQFKLLSDRAIEGLNLPHIEIKFSCN